LTIYTYPGVVIIRIIINTLQYSQSQFHIKITTSKPNNVGLFKYNPSLLNNTLNLDVKYFKVTASEYLTHYKNYHYKSGRWIFNTLSKVQHGLLITGQIPLKRIKSAKIFKLQERKLLLLMLKELNIKIILVCRKYFIAHKFILPFAR
jgi:hypothetical protein